MFFCLCAGPLLAAELRLVEGEYRYYENGELIVHEDQIRALPDDEQAAMAFAGTHSEPTETDPEDYQAATAQALWTFEIEPEPDTDEQIGDPVCVVTSFESEVSAETEGTTSAASASAGGRNGTADADADEDASSASASTSAPDAALLVDPPSEDEFTENTFGSITVNGDDQDNLTGDHQFIAFIGDFIALEAGSYAAAAAVYPDSASSGAATVMTAELQDDILDCQLSLNALVETGDGLIQISPDQASYQFGDEIELSATPEEGWVFAGWSGDAGGTDNPLLLTIDNNTEVLASFEVATYTVTAEAGNGEGEITPDSQEVEHGDDATFTVSPEPSWSVTSVTGDTCTPTFDSGDQWIASGITEDCAVTANFEMDTYTIGGTLSGLAADNSVTLQNNATDDLTLTADGDFTFSTALDDLTTYEVTVLDQPDGQFCSVTNASGTLAGSDVDDVAVSCVDIELSLSLNEIQFTGLNPGDSDEQALTLTNSGPVDLVIEQFSSPEAPFGFDPQDCAPLPHTLSPGQSCTVMLSFSPPGAGDFNDELSIASSALGSPSSVGLSGSAVSPAVPVPGLGLPAMLLLLLGMLLLGLRRAR